MNDQDSFFAKTPKPPYFAVIFTSEQSDTLDGYSNFAKRMEELARLEDGFLGIETVRAGRQGITVSYWSSQESIVKWKKNLEHKEAQNLGKEKWYQKYRVRITKVERDY